ncbi:hypothetical protein OE88DRAFT_912830 [Heliocybe sulcata]|uniref:Uncharacterized protein n=1 Tax=Heliocybe sulcata TaxID=5364 RepID=A0A5C3MN92_9AGAM|nr:hypothetical protein OE88DRAFT_912830 [Heliocybe sulcata]
MPGKGEYQMADRKLEYSVYNESSRYSPQVMSNPTYGRKHSEHGPKVSPANLDRRSSFISGGWKQCRPRGKHTRSLADPCAIIVSDASCASLISVRQRFQSPYLACRFSWQPSEQCRSGCSARRSLRNSYVLPASSSDAYKTQGSLDSSVAFHTSELPPVLALYISPIIPAGIFCTL